MCLARQPLCLARRLLQSDAIMLLGCPAHCSLGACAGKLLGLQPGQSTCKHPLLLMATKMLMVEACYPQSSQRS